MRWSTVLPGCTSPPHRGSVNEIKTLLTTGARVGRPGDRAARHGQTPLRVAMDRDRKKDAVTQLLSQKADPFISDSPGPSPWSVALRLLSQQANRDWISAIIDANAVDSTTATGKPCLVKLVQTGDLRGHYPPA